MLTLPPPFTEFSVNLSVALCKLRYHQTLHTGRGHREGGRRCLLKLLVFMVQKKRMTGMSSHYRYKIIFRPLDSVFSKAKTRCWSPRDKSNLKSPSVCAWKIFICFPPFPHILLKPPQLQCKVWLQRATDTAHQAHQWFPNCQSNPTLSGHLS